MRYDEIIEKLSKHKTFTNTTKDISSGKQIIISNGTKINCYTNGNILYQGTNEEEIKAFLGETTSCKNNKIFVVYGHDKNAKDQLELLLTKWNLEPIILDKQSSGGQTIIEKLEGYTSDVGYAIVLATPDDMGHRKDAADEIKPRVRQNVVLELGMFLSKLGRKKVAILLKEEKNFEHPSDIHGLVYISFKDHIEEAKISLAKELIDQGYNIDRDCLLK